MHANGIYDSLREMLSGAEAFVPPNISLNRVTAQAFSQLTGLTPEQLGIVVDPVMPTGWTVS